MTRHCSSTKSKEKNESNYKWIRKFSRSSFVSMNTIVKNDLTLLSYFSKLIPEMYVAPLWCRRLDSGLTPVCVCFLSLFFFVHVRLPNQHWHKNKLQQHLFVMFYRVFLLLTSESAKKRTIAAICMQHTATHCNTLRHTEAVSQRDT